MVDAQGPFDKIIKKLTNRVSIPTKEASIKIISGYGQCHEANSITEVGREQRWECGSAVASPLAWEYGKNPPMDSNNTEDPHTMLTVSPALSGPLIQRH